MYLITYIFKQQYSFFGALCEYVGNYNKFIIIVYWNVTEEEQPTFPYLWKLPW